MSSAFVPWVKRAPSNPVLTTASHEVAADGVGHPSLIRVPDWAGAPVDRNLLYVSIGGHDAVHAATAPGPEGPWTLDGAPVTVDGEPAIGRADVHVDHAAGDVRLYLSSAVNGTTVAAGTDGWTFETVAEVPGPPLLRTFRWRDAWWAVSSTGNVLRSDDGVTGWNDGDRLLSDAVRGVAALVDGDVVRLFYTEVGDCPERILHATVDLTTDWRTWTLGPSGVVLEPEEPYEGADRPLVPSKPGQAGEPVRQLRHPAVYVEGEQRWLVYAAGGEQAIGVACFIP